MRNETTICDVCGRAKVETNDWLIAVSAPDAPRSIAFGPARLRSEISELETTTEDICGADCAHKRLSRALNTQPEAELKEASCSQL